MSQNKYSMQFSFATKGKENIEHLDALRETLAELSDRPLSEIYAAFDMIPLQQVAPTDRLLSVGIVRKTIAEDVYAFFLVATSTSRIPHTELWSGICKSVYPHVRLDAVGSDGKGNRLCYELVAPPQIGYVAASYDTDD